MATTSVLPLGVCVGWACGTIGIAILFNTTNYLLLRFLLDYVGIAAFAASVILAIGKIYDAILNPCIGYVSDRVSSAGGRRRPFLLVGAVLCAAALPVMFSVRPSLPTGLALAVVTGGVIFYATAYSLFNVPYLAMPAEMTTSADQRARLMAMRVAGIGLGQMIAGSAAPILIEIGGGGAAGHRFAAWWLAPVVLLSCGAAWYATRTAAFSARDPSDGRSGRQWRLLIENRPFAVLMAVKLLLLSGIAVASATLALFITHVLQASDTLLGVVAFANAAGIVGSMAAWRFVLPRWGAKRTYLAAAVLYAAISLSFLAASAGTSHMAFAAGMGLLGIASGGLLLVGQVLLPETIDFDRKANGTNREGLFAGVYSTVERVAFAAGLVLAGALLTTMGYQQGTGGNHSAQGVEALRAVRLCAWGVPAALVCASAAALMRYQAGSTASVPETRAQDVLR